MSGGIVGNDSKLYELAERVFEAFNDFWTERNLIVGTDNPITYISDEDGKTLIYTRGEYAEELIEGINKLHARDPLKHSAFETAVHLCSTTDLVQELERREGVTLYAHLEPGQIVSIVSKPEDYDFVEGVSGPAKILVVID